MTEIILPLDIFYYLFNFINIGDIIYYSWINKHIYSYYNQLKNYPPKLFIEKTKWRLDKLNYLYNQNTKWDTYIIFQKEFESIDFYFNNILNNLSQYRKLLDYLPDEYYILLKLLCYYRIPTINIIDYNIINDSINDFLKNGLNVIPLFYTEDLCACLWGLEFMDNHLKIVSGNYISYNMISKKFSSHIQDISSNSISDDIYLVHDYFIMILLYGFTSCYSCIPEDYKHEIIKKLAIPKYYYIDYKKSLEEAFSSLLYEVYQDAITHPNTKGKYYQQYSENNLPIKQDEQLEIDLQVYFIKDYKYKL